jgi:hypothetical protein
MRKIEGEGGGGRGIPPFSKMPTPVLKSCLGCGKDVPQPKYYEDDSVTPWCVECFVTEEQLEEMKKTMPCWIDFKGAATVAVPKKIRLISKPASGPSGAAVQTTVAAPQKKPGKKLVGQESAPADASLTPVAAAAPLPLPPQKKKPVLLKKPQPQAVAAVPSESAPPQKKKPVLLKKKTPTAPGESPQSSP